MNMALKSSLDEIISASDALRKSPNLSPTVTGHLNTIHRNATELQEKNVFALNVIGLASKSTELRRNLTAMVGYSALLNSPKLANHASMNADQLSTIVRLHDLSRRIHWRLDNLIAFANQMTRPHRPKPQDIGMLNIGGYLLAQAESYVVRQHVSEVNVPKQIPFVYANDSYTHLMLRGLFATAIETISDAKVDLRLYMVMRVVRIRLTVEGAAAELPRVTKHLQVEQVKQAGSDLDHTDTLITKRGTLKTTNLLQLGIYTAASLAAEQNARLKVDTQGEALVFTLTMPTVPELSSPLTPQVAAR